MTDQLKATRRDEVLFAFHRACPCPTAEQVTEWTHRHSEFAEDIFLHAVIRRSWAVASEEAREEPDKLLLNRGRSRALNAIYNAQEVASNAADTSADVTRAESDLSIRQLDRPASPDQSVLKEDARRVRRTRTEEYLSRLPAGLQVQSA